jgi:flagellar protein FlaG
MVTQLALSRIQAALNEVRAARPQEGEVRAPERANASRGGVQSFLANLEEPFPRFDAEALEHAVKDIESSMHNLQRALEFSIDEDSGRTVIKVIDKETDEVIRQIPPAEVIAIARRIEHAIGLFVEDEA